MKKIMFNDKYGLTDAVLQGRKTMTRRVIGNLLNFDPRQDWIEWGVDGNGKANIAIFHNETYKYSLYPQYQPGEVVAVAQAYKDIAGNAYFASQCAANEEPVEYRVDEAGWTNKMFVKAYYMPHQIRITNVKVERLQDISYEDCLKEGVFVDVTAPKCYQPFYTFVNSRNKYNCPIGYESPQYAFAALIDKVSCKGTWERNPYVFAYEFQLIKEGGKK